MRKACLQFANPSVRGLWVRNILLSVDKSKLKLPFPSLNFQSSNLSFSQGDLLLLGLPSQEQWPTLSTTDLQKFLKTITRSCTKWDSYFYIASINGKWRLQPKSERFYPPKRSSCIRYFLMKNLLEFHNSRLIFLVRWLIPSGCVSATCRRFVIPCRDTSLFRFLVGALWNGFFRWLSFPKTTWLPRFEWTNIFKFKFHQFIFA